MIRTQKTVTEFIDEYEMAALKGLNAARWLLDWQEFSDDEESAAESDEDDEDDDSMQWTTIIRMRHRHRLKKHERTVILLIWTFVEPEHYLWTSMRVGDGSFQSRNSEW